MSKQKSSQAFFLVSPHFKTIRISPAQPLTIGREKYNDLVLNDLLVSRQHSVIQWEKDKFTINDLNSRNGTFVNNSRIEKTALEDGDVIKIGGYDFTFRMSSPIDIERFLLREGVKRSSQETLIDADFGLRFSEKGFSGDLSSLALIEVVQTLYQGLKTGLLSIKSDEPGCVRANLFFENGEIIHAERGEKQGFSAILSILEQTQGQFEFQNEIATGSRTVTQPTMAILLEASRQLDEKHRENTSH